MKSRRHVSVTRNCKALTDLAAPQNENCQCLSAAESECSFTDKLNRTTSICYKEEKIPDVRRAKSLTT